MFNVFCNPPIATTTSVTGIHCWNHRSNHQRDILHPSFLPRPGKSLSGRQYYQRHIVSLVPLKRMELVGKPHPYSHVQWTHKILFLPGPYWSCSDHEPKQYRYVERIREEEQDSSEKMHNTTYMEEYAFHLTYELSMVTCRPPGNPSHCHRSGRKLSPFRTKSWFQLGARRISPLRPINSWWYWLSNRWLSVTHPLGASYPKTSRRMTPIVWAPIMAATSDGEYPNWSCMKFSMESVPKSAWHMMGLGPAVMGASQSRRPQCSKRNWIALSGGIQNSTAQNPASTHRSARVNLCRLPISRSAFMGTSTALCSTFSILTQPSHRPPIQSWNTILRHRAGMDMSLRNSSKISARAFWIIVAMDCDCNCRCVVIVFLMSILQVFRTTTKESLTAFMW